MQQNSTPLIVVTAKVAATSIVIASAGFGAVYAARVGAHGGWTLAGLTILFAISLELASFRAPPVRIRDMTDDDWAEKYVARRFDEFKERARLRQAERVAREGRHDALRRNRIARDQERGPLRKLRDQPCGARTREATLAVVRGSAKVVVAPITVAPRRDLGRVTVADVNQARRDDGCQRRLLVATTPGARAQKFTKRLHGSANLLESFPPPPRDPSICSIEPTPGSGRSRLMGASMAGLAVFTERLRTRIGSAANLKNNQRKSNRPSRVAARRRVGRPAKA
jgi:hypothetical protein